MGYPSKLKLWSGTILPDTAYVKLVYKEIHSQAGSIAPTRIFSVNGIGVTNQTVPTGQPLGHDQWGNFYDSYQVLASKIKQKVVIGQGGTAMGLVIYPSNTSIASSFDNAIELPYSKSKYIGSSDSKSVQVLTNYIACKKLIGIPIEDAGFRSTFGLNPVTQLFWQTRLTSLDKISNVTAFVITEITYYCKFFDRVNLVSS